MIVVYILLAIVIITAAFFWLGNYFYNFALNARKEKKFIQDNPNLARSEAVMPDVAELENYNDDAFRKQVPSSSISILSRDKLQLKLHANIYEQEQMTDKWAIVVHGYGARASVMTRWIRGFYEKGYHVLAPDLRGHGESEGDYIGMGWHDRLDILQWIDEILAKNQNATITLFGISMGGATVMMASGENLPANVKVIVEDCGYTSVQDIFAYQLKDLFKLPKFPVLNAANMVTKIRAGFDLSEASALEKLRKCELPMLFIHGDADRFVPFKMVEEVFAAADTEKEKLIIPGAGHGEAVLVNPKLYWETIWSFIDRYI
ncbi:hypothetical protein SAMN04487944_112100 [Gracilibacillus ureilyticus]|uniref:Serine aminopeptidase S33 domain-containing protein n=1 Tax=Gracilibacillus ureilyticus TaxID=531814 RepID=A0A1H9T134_9BACI|nr:alpha/beta hydrolase [Gracilibacillus ureilyticus]SER90714.1 hypothetical protein SAMN04487944_112100 [Gracilibacillus ureilyticus]